MQRDDDGHIKEEENRREGGESKRRRGIKGLFMRGVHTKGKGKRELTCGRKEGGGSQLHKRFPSKNRYGS